MNSLNVLRMNTMKPQPPKRGTQEADKIAGPKLRSEYATFIYIVERSGTVVSYSLESASTSLHTCCIQGLIYSFGEEGMQLVQPSKFFSVTIFRTHSIGSYWHVRV